MIVKMTTQRNLLKKLPSVLSKSLNNPKTTIPHTSGSLFSKASSKNHPARKKPLILSKALLFRQPYTSPRTLSKALSSRQSFAPLFTSWIVFGSEYGVSLRTINQSHKPNAGNKGKGYATVTDPFLTAATSGVGGDSLASAQRHLFFRNKRTPAAKDQVNALLDECSRILAPLNQKEDDVSSVPEGKQHEDLELARLEAQLERKQGAFRELELIYGKVLESIDEVCWDLEEDKKALNKIVESLEEESKMVEHVGESWVYKETRALLDGFQGLRTRVQTSQERYATMRQTIYDLGSKSLRV
ncbi:MAG: hypothetical protein LQ338_003174 [Usnochroma carphineum]|nr:MAG: hypothetical protein LQ338_003174 [Usnochroma carphineum]